MTTSLDHGPALLLRLSHVKVITISSTWQVACELPLLLMKKFRHRGAKNSDSASWLWQAWVCL